MTSETFRLRPIDKRGANAELWLTIAAFTKAGSVLLFAVNAAALAEGESLPSALWVLWDTLPLLSVLIVGAYWVSIIFVALWVHRASVNAHKLSRGLEISPGWAVGWYFVPLANLLMPFRAMDEIWRASQNPSAWRTAATSPVLRWWWALWLASGICASASSVISRAATDAQSLIIGSVFGAVSALSSIGAALVLRWIVRRITLAQRRHRDTEVF